MTTCVTKVFQCGKTVTTIEAFGQRHVHQQAWLSKTAQCGCHSPDRYAGPTKRTKTPTDADTR
jgi:aerobic-type carbon monoxide dehydrogenase small subunit (CoxS/CutS family)